MARARKNADFGTDILKIYDDFGKRLYEWTGTLKSKPKVVDRNGCLGGGGSNRGEGGIRPNGGPPGPGRDPNLHLRSLAGQCYFHTHVKGEICHRSKKEKSVEW
jgi:hypothetical protein